LTTGDPVFCGDIVRNANTGKITEFFAFNQTVGYIRSAGVDSVIAYRFRLPVGSISINLAETHQLKLEQSVPGAPVEVDLGQLNASGRLGAGFKDRAVLNLGYFWNDLETTWRLNYLGKIQDANDPAQVIYQPYNNVSSFIYNDAQVRYTFNVADKSKITAYLGANNIFNKKPPFLPGGMVSNVTGSSTADSYDEVGVFWYAGLKLKF
jgi:outer membrane receptor protein involved in Fe transport